MATAPTHKIKLTEVVKRFDDKTVLDGVNLSVEPGESVAIIGGGAAAVSSAWNIASTWPGTQVDLYFPGERALTRHHPRVWTTLSRR